MENEPSSSRNTILAKCYSNKNFITLNDIDFQVNEKDSIEPQNNFTEEIDNHQEVESIVTNSENDIYWKTSTAPKNFHVQISKLTPKEREREIK